MFISFTSFWNHKVAPPQIKANVMFWGLFVFFSFIYININYCEESVGIMAS